MQKNMACDNCDSQVESGETIRFSSFGVIDREIESISSTVNHQGNITDIIKKTTSFDKSTQHIHEVHVCSKCKKGSENKEFLAFFILLFIFMGGGLSLIALLPVTIIVESKNIIGPSKWIYALASGYGITFFPALIISWRKTRYNAEFWGRQLFREKTLRGEGDWHLEF